MPENNDPSLNSGEQASPSEIIADGLYDLMNKPEIVNGLSGVLNAMAKEQVRGT